MGDIRPKAEPSRSESEHQRRRGGQNDSNGQGRGVRPKKMDNSSGVSWAIHPDLREPGDRASAIRLSQLQRGDQFALAAQEQSLDVAACLRAVRRQVQLPGGSFGTEIDFVAVLDRGEIAGEEE